MAAFPKKDRVLVEGVNVVKKHSKPSHDNPQGGINGQEAAIHVSNVMLLDPKSNEPTRVGFKVVEGKKVTYSKKIRSNPGQRRREKDY